MVTRLANVIYWLGCTVAAVLAVGGIFAGLNENTTYHEWEVFAFFEGLAVITWIIGKAIRYILRGI